MAKAPSPKIQRRIARAVGEWLGRHDPRTGAQLRGPVWTGMRPHRPVLAGGYTPRYAEANDAIDRRELVGITPNSNLARVLVQLPRRERRTLLAAVASKNGARRHRLERKFQRDVAAHGIRPA